MLFPAGALAAPAWLAPADLSALEQSAARPQVVLDGAGNALAVWSRAGVVQAAVRPAGGVWQGAENLSQPGAVDPQVALDPAGNAVAVWLQYTADGAIRQAATRPAGGSWQTPQDLSQAEVGATVDPNPPQVALDAAGNAVVVWQRYNGSHFIVQAATRPAASGVWQGAQDLSVAGQPGQIANPQVALDAAGNALAVWRRSNGTHNIVQAAARPAASGVWQGAQDLSEVGQSASGPQVAFDAAGNALAVWQRSNGTNVIVQAAARPAGGSWQAPLDLSEVGQTASGPQVAFDVAGNAVAVWVRSNGTNFIAQAAARPAGGAWQGAQDLSQLGQNAFGAQVALDPAGNARVVWERSGVGPPTIVQGAARPAGGAWQAPQDLSQGGQSALNPQLAVDPAGNAVAVWDRSNGSNTIVQAAPYDAAGPVMGGLSVPASGTAGTALQFGVSAFDIWSTLAGSASWSFGDGATASGANVSHTYAGAGTYTVSVTQADSLGNASSATRQIVVSPPLPALTISNARLKEGNRGTKAMTFLVQLSAASATPVTVGFKTQKGTAKPRSDFVGRSGTLTFAPGQTLMKLVVKIKGDLRDERNEKFKVLLANAVGARIADAEGVGTIRDNDP